MSESKHPRTDAFVATTPDTIGDINEMADVYNTLLKHSEEIETELTRANERIELMRAALKRSLSWLSSYPGDGALNAYQQAHVAIAESEKE